MCTHLCTRAKETSPSTPGEALFYTFSFYFFPFCSLSGEGRFSPIEGSNLPKSQAMLWEV